MSEFWKNRLWPLELVSVFAVVLSVQTMRVKCGEDNQPYKRTFNKKVMLKGIKYEN